VTIRLVNCGPVARADRSSPPQRIDVIQHSQDREEVWTILNLVQHHEASESLEGEHGLIQPRQILRLFQIEKVTLSFAARHQLSCERLFRGLNVSPLSLG